MPALPALPHRDGRVASLHPFGFATRVAAHSRAVRALGRDVTLPRMRFAAGCSPRLPSCRAVGGPLLGWFATALGPRAPLAIGGLAALSAVVVCAGYASGSTPRLSGLPLERSFVALRGR